MSETQNTSNPYAQSDPEAQTRMAQQQQQQQHQYQQQQQTRAQQAQAQAQQAQTQQAQAQQVNAWQAQASPQQAQQPWQATPQMHQQASAQNAWQQPSQSPSQNRSWEGVQQPGREKGRYRRTKGGGASSMGQSAARETVRPSGGRTFLFGFLGALLACALAFGGYLAWRQFFDVSLEPVQSGELSSQESASGIALGNQNPTAVTEDPTVSLAEAVAAKALPSVVCIYVYSAPQSYYGYFGAMDTDSADNLQQSSLGSGIVLTEDGYIITNYHVVENSEALKVNVGGVEYDAELIGSDPSSDLAVIKAQDASGLVPAEIGDSDDLTVGQWVMTVGSPFGLDESVATGVVSATSRSRIVEGSSYGYGFSSGTSEPTIYPNMIQTDAAINPGNSGGALVDANGRVIGINTLIASYSGNYSGVGFAIPINYAINIADQIIAGKTPTHAKLGVSLSTVDASSAQRYNLAVDAGAYVAEVVAGSGADEAGIEVGDIVVSFDGEAVKTSTDLTLDIREHNPGDTVSITVNRDGKELELTATLGSDEQDLVAQQQEEEEREQQGEVPGLSYEELLELLDSLR